MQAAAEPETEGSASDGQEDRGKRKLLRLVVALYCRLEGSPFIGEVRSER